MNNSLHQPNSLYHKSVEMINAGIDMMNFLNSPGPKSLDNTKNCLKTTNGDEG